MVKTDSEYLRLAVKTCQKKNDSSPITNKVFFSNWVRRILLSEMQSLKVFLQVFLCNTKQNQTSGKGQELTRNKEGNTHRHTHTHTQLRTMGEGEKGAASGAGDLRTDADAINCDFCDSSGLS